MRIGTACPDVASEVRSAFACNVVQRRLNDFNEFLIVHQRKCWVLSWSDSGSDCYIALTLTSTRSFWRHRMPFINQQKATFVRFHFLCFIHQPCACRRGASAPAERRAWSMDNADELRLYSVRQRFMNLSAATVARDPAVAGHPVALGPGLSVWR